MKTPVPPVQRNARPAGPPTGVPPLNGSERLAVVVAVLVGIAVGALGFYASFDGVSQKAAEWGFDKPWVLPAAIDTAIPFFSMAHLLLIRVGMPLAWVRLVPWGLSLVTCALNVAVGESLWSKVAHGSMSLLWVGVSEVAAHTYATRIGAVTGRRKRLDKVRLSRWFLDPLATASLWRRMKLWELSSYDQVIKLEQERLVYQASLRARFGRSWRRKAPVQALLPLRLARHGVPLAETAPAGLKAAGIDLADLPVFALMPQPSAADEIPLLPLDGPAPALPPAPKRPAPKPPAGQAPPHVPAPRSGEQDQDQNQDEDGQKPKTEDELYTVMVAALEAGEIHRFNQGGDLTGSGMATHYLKQSAGNGRKVRNRLLTRYAAHLSDKGVAVPKNFTVEDLVAVPA
ncbi:DUF2637 domain-containing protein [Streptomyces albidoflavus]